MQQSATNPNQYEFRGQLPAGSYQFKVAMDGTWNETYGKEGFTNSNIPLRLAGPTQISITFDYTTKHIGLRLPDQEPALTETDSALIQAPATHPGAGQRFYFVLTDRFHNGDPTNDRGGATGDRLTTGFDPTDKAFFHGGDLRGIIAQLDYIQNLGTTAIWLTPSFQNQAVQGEAEQASAGYHGYWITDFTRIDPHLGSNEDMRELIAQAHSRGMKVYFDIVVNHTADLISYEDNTEQYIDLATRPYRDATGAEIDISALASSPDFPALDATISFPHRPTRRESPRLVPDWLNDVTLYHNRGAMDPSGQGESALLGDFGNLDDLMTEHPRVVRGMADIYNTWVDMGLDGFRIDTVKHVNMEFWRDWTKLVHQHANEAGRPDFFTFGEVYDRPAHLLAAYVRGTDMSAVLDFGYQHRATEFARGKGGDATLKRLFADDDYYTTPTSSAIVLPTFLGNHDMGRVGFLLRESDNAMARAELAHSLLYLTRGQPVIYYGDEQGFVGVGNGTDKHARQDMFATATTEYAEQPLLDGTQLGSSDRYDQSAQLYRHISALAKLRQDHPALSAGAQIERWSSSGSGMYAFSRVERAEKVEYLVAVNNSAAPVTNSVTALSKDATFAPVGASGPSVRSDAAGRVEITVPPFGAVVYRADAPLTEVGAAPAGQPTRVTGGLTLAGHRLTGLAPVGTDMSGLEWSETSFSYRLAGEEQWHPLGVDTGQDARVFHDVSALSAGTVVEYRTVTVDANGNRHASAGYGVVGVDLTTGTQVQQTGVLVTVPGTFNSELGCTGGVDGDWDPACLHTKLSKDPESGLYVGKLSLPAGEHQYKIAVGGSWEENYGTPTGENVSLSLPQATEVTFIYDHSSHDFFTSPPFPLVTLPGTFGAALGCTQGDLEGNWAPACLAGLMWPGQDGKFHFTSKRIPAGEHEVKVAHGLSWAESYGDGGQNYRFTLPAGQAPVFTYSPDTHRLEITFTDLGSMQSTAARAIWVDGRTLALPTSQFDGHNPAQVEVALLVSPTTQVELRGGRPHAADGEASSLPLTRAGATPTAAQLAKYPHLRGYSIYTLSDADAARLGQLLTGSMAVLVSQGQTPLTLTGVQIAGALDALYAPAAAQTRLGVTWTAPGTQQASPTLRLWAPTAKQVRLQLWDNPEGTGEPTQYSATRDEASGTWSVEGSREWKNRAYRYLVDVYVPSEAKVVTNAVTDPYSLGLTTASTHSVLLDMADPALAPPQWQDLRVPEVKRSVDQMIYELHVRDFSITDQSVPAALRGTYKAFTVSDSAGMRHLRELGQAGVNSIHLLPTNDIATIPEPASEQAVASIPAAAPDSTEQQAAVAAVKDLDGFNWGYDPYHYFAPEGSYASDPSAAGRVREYREMVAAIGHAGMRVVADQVFNHTASSGQGGTSVLDKVVPGYYHRLNADGKVENSTCCENLATENALAEQLMVDAVTTWARDYKVSGFRFDLMGHSSRANLEAVQAGLRQLTLDKDGIDGATIHLYGEGWNFGEVANNARFYQATQGQLNGTGIATFNDRLRDGVHGHEGHTQAFGTGLVTDPNGHPQQGVEHLRYLTDLVRLGMAGNLASYSFETKDGVKSGAELSYGSGPAGYASQPGESVNYVDAHDNQTLYDLSVLQLPVSTSRADRVRMNNLQLATVALGQSPAFWHGGTDLLRSKSLDRDSYNSGDHFNAIDWSGQQHNFGVGLPPAEKNQQLWEQQAPLLRNPELRAQPADLEFSRQLSLELVRLRYATPLMRLGSAQAIQEKVSFPAGGPNAQPGLLMMLIDDTAGADVDAKLDGVLTVFNASPQQLTQRVDSLAGRRFALSAIQAEGVDQVVKQTKWDANSGTVIIPPRTVAVLHELEQIPTPPTQTPTVAPPPTQTPTQTPTVAPPPTQTPTQTPTVAPPPTQTPSSTPSTSISAIPSPGPAIVHRVWGADRVETALAAARAGRFSGTTAVVTSGLGFADAVTAGPLAAAIDGPLLLTTASTVEPGVLAELHNMQVTEVYLVGGTGTVSSLKETQLRRAGFSVRRLAGPDRFSTATAVAAEVARISTVERVFLANGMDYADSLAAGPTAARHGGIVLLTRAAQLPPATRAYLAAHSSLPVVAVGGLPAQSLRGSHYVSGINLMPVVGADRYATAALLVQRFHSAPSALVVASGATFADGLPGTALAANLRAPLLLSRPTALSPEVASYLTATSTVRRVELLGGTTTLHPAVESALERLLKDR
ncbi:pullulanase-type alpha-1,6-glucosidase [Buchananella felis]